MSKLSRRSLVTSAAALPVLAVPALAAEAAKPDPVFVAIERFREAEEAYVSLCEHEGGLIASGQELTSAPDDHRTSEMVATVKASVDARVKLASTSPTTLAGLSALLAFVVSESDEKQIWVFEEGEEMETFVRSLERGARMVQS